jgi:hypothetical protein
MIKEVLKRGGAGVQRLAGSGAGWSPSFLITYSRVTQNRKVCFHTFTTVFVIVCIIGYQYIATAV